MQASQQPLVKRENMPCTCVQLVCWLEVPQADAANSRSEVGIGELPEP